MARHIVTNIDWDATQEEVEDNCLPNEVNINIPNKLIGDARFEYVENYLSDNYGYCVNSYDIVA